MPTLVLLGQLAFLVLAALVWVAERRDARRVQEWYAKRGLALRSTVRAFTRW